MTDGDFGSQAGGIGIGQQQNDRHIQQAVDRLLSKLLAFMAAYPIRADEAMPEHSVAWMTGIAKGPGKIIGDAMAITPVLWLSALPEGVVIVKRDLLERCGIGKELIDLAQ